MTPFNIFAGSPTGDTTLTSALLAPGGSGIAIVASSIKLQASGQDAVNFYDGSLAPLGIGAGLLLTSGTTPGTNNTVGWFGTDNSGASGFTNGDADIDAVVNTVFQTQSYDATTLAFDFTVADPAATSVSFDLVFGSDEYPEWVDQFVDSAIVMVNGVNYALFNHDPLHPLSVVSSNLAAGYFQDNAGNALPIEYDGVSHVLKIVAPIIAGATNHIKIGIADTGDHVYDSGIFLSNFSAGTIPGSGVVSAPITSTSGPDTVTGTAQAELFNLLGGDDTVYAGAGDDIVVAGAGNDVVYGGSGADQLKGDAGDDLLDGGADIDAAVFSGASTNYVVTAVAGGFTIADTTAGAPEGADTLTNVEYAKFSDGLFSIGAGGTLTPVANPGTPPANTPGSVVISGIGSLGKTLTATVSDPDGIAGAVSYQWQVSSGGGGWSNVGTGSNNYLVSAADVGKDIQVQASYVDSGSHSESPVSVAKAIQQTSNGDLVVTLMQLDAPVGASNINPLTTLVQNAIALGLSPNQAALGIKAVLGLPGAVNLQTYDAYAVLLNNPSDATALAVEKVAVQVAVLTSLSDDDTGVNLTLKILEAGANNQTLDLANAADLANILGLDTSTFDITDKKTYPQPLREIFDRNDNISQAGDVAAIQAEWQDFLSIQDFVASTSIADLSVHINQAPTGSATASLTNGLENTDYTLSASDLMAGFSDSDGGTLSVSGLSASNGTAAQNVDGSWTITPTLNYSGPVELTYSVLDGQGGSAPASQLFGIAATPVVPVNTAPIGTATAVLAAGTEDTAYTVSAANLLAGFSDVDSTDVLSVSSLSTSNGTAIQNLDGSWTITPTLNSNGAVTLTYNVTDSNGGNVGGTQSYNLTAVNDAPTAVADSANTTGQTPVSINVLANDFDVDNTGSALANAGLSIKAGSVVVADAAQGTAQIVGTQIEFTAATNFTGTATLSYVATDGLADSAAASVTISVSPVSVPGVILGSSGNDFLHGTSGNDWIDGGAGADVMVGGLGDDTYVVDNKNDRVIEFAGQGIDTVRAGVDFELSKYTENLTLTGSRHLHGKGNDTANVLIGNDGKNEFDGGKGNDVLIGGGGEDQLTGGAGADIFRFLTLSDSVVGSHRDTIEDFKAGTDRIDLSAIDAIAGTASNDAFTFISTGFTHLAGQVRFDAVKHILSGDVNGDGLADFEIALAGVSHLGVDSLIL